MGGAIRHTCDTIPEDDLMEPTLRLGKKGMSMLPDMRKHVVEIGEQGSWTEPQVVLNRELYGHHVTLMLVNSSRRMDDISREEPLTVFL